MLDFTSALYLGFTHPTRALHPWASLTTGRPAALGTTVLQERVSEGLAVLTGCAAATLRSSTLHVCWDLFGMLGRRSAIYLDGGVYPVAQWGAERAAARGIRVTAFPHYDAGALQEAIMKSPESGRPVVVADGFCPGCGRGAPLRDYVMAIQGREGLLVLDDTQALGILGQSPRPDAPYGFGGGGSLRHQRVESDRVVLIGSLAKAFGVPVAVLAGSMAIVRSFERHSETRVHTSPPSAASIHAAALALRLNRAEGDARRARLGALVGRFQEQMRAAGVAATGGSFPVQALDAGPGRDGRRLHDRLVQSGVRSVLRRGARRRATVAFLFTARHSPADIDLTSALIRRVSGNDGAEAVRGTHARTTEF